MSTTGSHASRRRGTILVSAMTVLLVLVGLVAALAPLVRVDVRSAGQNGEGLRARYLARAGVIMALATLKQDDATVDGLQEDWATLGQQGETAYPLGEGQFRVEVVDASSRLDMNQANRATLMLLPGIDDATADEILAWRGAAGANSSPITICCRVPTSSRRRRSTRSRNYCWCRGSLPRCCMAPQGYTTGAEQLPWNDLLAIDTASPNQDAAGQNRVDLNTAPANQLASSSGGALNRQQAQAIVQYRQGRRFSSLADLLSVPGLNRNTVRQLVDHVT